MKRIVYITLLAFAVTGLKAQDAGYVCTGNHVNVRTGPGKNYPVYDDNGEGPKRQLSKGDVVANLGEKKNGFCLVSGKLEWGGDEREGWVSAQYLRPVTLCPKCFGTGDMNVAKVDIDLRTCNKCKGKGYIK